MRIIRAVSAKTPRKNGHFWWEFRMKHCDFLFASWSTSSHFMQCTFVNIVVAIRWKKHFQFAENTNFNLNENIYVLNIYAVMFIGDYEKKKTTQLISIIRCILYSFIRALSPANTLAIYTQYFAVLSTATRCCLPTSRIRYRPPTTAPAAAYEKKMIDMHIHYVLQSLLFAPSWHIFRLYDNSFSGDLLPLSLALFVCNMNIICNTMAWWLITFVGVALLSIISFSALFSNSFLFATFFFNCLILYVFLLWITYSMMEIILYSLHKLATHPPRPSHSCRRSGKFYSICRFYISISTTKKQEDRHMPHIGIDTLSMSIVNTVCLGRNQMAWR